MSKDENMSTAVNWAEIYGKKQIEHLEDEIERLKAEIIEMANEMITFYDGMERAAVIAEDFPGDNMMIAAAIRAEIKHD